MDSNEPEKLLSAILQTHAIPLGSPKETIQYIKRELLRCPCEDLCSSCRVMHRWLVKMEPRYATRPSFRVIPGGKP